MKLFKIFIKDFSVYQNDSIHSVNRTRIIDVYKRQVRGWEIEGRYPKKHDLYQKLADILSCDISYLMTEEEAFITEASEQFGNRCV